MIKLGFAAVALACGGLCLLFIPGVARYLAGAMTIIVAGVCIVEGISLFGAASKSMASNELDETDMEADFLEPDVEPTETDTPETD